jgi:regulatory protein
MTEAGIHDVSVRMLARRALSAAEVKQRLLRKGFAAGAVAAEMTRLRHLGMLDEGELAHAVVREQLRTGHGRRAAAAALRRRRIPRDASDEALASLDPEAESTALAAALAKASRRRPDWRRLPDERRKVVRYLLARGFSAGSVSLAVGASGRGDLGPPETDDAGDP